MPQEEEEVDDRGENGSIQPTDGDRDRLFAQFSEATDLDQIISLFRELCQETQVDPDSYESVYPSLKAGLTAWKPASIWELLDGRAELGVYESQNACRGRRVLVVGAGPVGLRMAIETALLGARVDLVEKRGSFSRNNSLHLWPFLITDLRNLGAKKFYGRFATGSLDHICIRILQSILVKVCLLLGVRVHANVTFNSLTEPTTSTGWRVSTQPSSCTVNALEFDAILAADGKKNSLPGFKLKEFRAKLALAITANFVNGNTQHENSVPEISGVSYVYNMDFFNSLSEKYGIELENIVYYKNETHYFVMTAKKPSLLKKGVLKKDYNDPKQLLSPSNIDTTALKNYTVEAAGFSTKGALPLNFLKNHRGEDDVALFDFTSLFASENAARIVERKGRRILLCVAGDSLNEPFWPTGSGCGRGFLGAFDAAWMLKRYCSGTSPLELVEEREALFYLLPQTTPERLGKNLTGYTIDPKTRYPNLGELVPPGDVSHLYDTDDPSAKPSPQVHQQQRQLPPSPVKEAVPRSSIVKAATVSEGLGQLGKKRSRSSEDLKTIPETTQVKKTASPSRTSKQEHTSQEASPAEKNPSLQDKIKMFKDREVPSPSSRKPPRTDKEKQKEAAKPIETSMSPKPTAKEGATKTPKSPKSKQKGFRHLMRSKSKSPSPTLSSEDEAKEKESTTKVKKVADSPKKHEDTHPRPTGHPLSVAKQAKTGHPESPSTEAKEKNKNEAKRTEDEKQMEAATASVADIVKRLDPHQPSSEPASGKKKKEKGKKEEKSKRKESKDKKGAKEEKSGGLLSLFKSKKSYDVSKATSQSAKKSKKASSEKHAVQQISLQSLPLQERIERLRALGIGRAETDGSELVLSLEELRDLELSHGLIPVEKEGQGARGERNKSPAGQSEDGLESEESNRSRSSTPVCSSGAEEARPQSRTSHASTGAATYGSSSRGVSPVQGDWRVGAASGEEEGSEEGRVVEEEMVEEGVFTMERTPSVVDTVRQLEPVSAAYSYDQMVTRRKAEERKSKEFELAELHRQSKADSSNPLWLARIIQGMGKHLERLRKDQNSILATKTTLQIINTILSNVQLHPSDDTYRRVRVSSQRFKQKVWQFSEAAQFLARAGWVEIGNYIVLPMGQTVDNAKRVLDKHLNIVNQMLWSQQLELPDSPGVLRKIEERGSGATRRHKTITAAMVAWRQSYSSRIVAESLMEVEEEQEAIEAELVRMNSSTQYKDRESSPDTFNTCEVSEERAEEVRTMKAASAARSKWLERQRKESLEQRRDREYKLILESELYDLPQSLPSVQAESTSSLASPSPTHSLSVTPDPRSTSPSSTSPSAQDTCVSPEIGKEEEEETNGVEEADSTSQPGQATDAQYSTPDSIRQDMMEYEKITLEAAAQVRQKWTES